MKKNFIIIVFFISLFLFSNDIAFAEDFGAMVVVSNDTYLESKWYNTVGVEGYVPSIHAIEDVYKEETIYIRLFIKGNMLNDENFSDVQWNIIIKNSNDEIYYQSKDLVALNQKLLNAKGLFLANDIVKIAFDDIDIFGKYSIEIQVIDNISHKKIIVKNKFNLIPYKADIDNLSEKDFFRIINNYYQNPNSHIIIKMLKSLLPIADKAKKDKDFILLIAPFFQTIFNDNEYLLPHFMEYFNSLNMNEKEILIPIVKAISLNNKKILSTFSDDILLEKIKKRQYPNIWDNKIDDAIELDMLWSVFFATGDIKPLEKIIFWFKLRNSDDIKKRAIGSASMWSVESNIFQHDLIRAYAINILKKSKSLDDDDKVILALCLARKKEYLKSSS